jgi:high affinity sulfate transporter 1
VPPEYGLITAPLALLAYAVFGSSRHLFVGPSSTVAIISASVVAPLAAGDEELYLLLTVWLAIATGVFFVTLGLLRMGWVANFMAAPVLAGFMVGLAVVIAVGQLDKVLGIEAVSGNVTQELRSMLNQISEWSWPTIIIGLTALALLFLLEETMPRLPGALIVMLLAIIASVIFDFEGNGIHVVGEIPAQLPTLDIPPWPGWDLMADIAVGAFAVVIVAFAESYAAAKSYAAKFGYEVDANQEMIGVGAANLGAGLSGGFVVDGSLSKTAAGVAAGQKSQMTSIVAAVLTLITIVALTWLFEPLPEAVLGAIVIHAVWKLIRIRTFTRLWSFHTMDFWLALAAFLGVVLIDLLPGILIGIILSLLALIYRASFPQGAELGYVEGELGHVTYVDVDSDENAQTVPGVVVYRPDGPLIFSNAEAFSKQARSLLWRRVDPPAGLLVIDCEEMYDLDSTGAEELIALHQELTDADVGLWLTRLHSPVREVAERTGVMDAIGEENVFANTRAAGTAIRQRGYLDEG